jgi:hypothetical protein
MSRSCKTRWLRPLAARRQLPARRTPRLGVMSLEQRDVPAAFTPGDIVVYRVGDGSATNGFTTASTGALNTSAAPVFLDEYTPAGTLVQSIPMPTATGGANQPHRLTAGGSTFGDGLLNLSADGRYLLVTGYDAAPGTASVTSTAPASVNRVIGRVDSTGALDTTTGLSDSTAAIRSAASADGFALWGVGTSGSGPIRATTFGTSGPSTGVSTTFTTQNAVSIYNGQLYISAGASGIDGVASVGSGLPVTGGTTETPLAGFPTTGTPFPAPRQFFFSPDGGTIYLADSRTAVNTTPSGFFGGLQVWKFNGTSWGTPIGGAGGNVPNYVITPNASQNEGLVSITPDFSGANPVFYAVTAESSGTVQDKLVKIVDGGSAAASTVTVLGTAPAAVVGTSTQEYFRGVSFVPNPIGTTSDSVSVQSSAPGGTQVGSSVTFTATVTGLPANTPTGYVTFQETNGSTTKTVAVVQVTPGGSSSQATAQFTDSTLPVGTSTITAVYGGDNVYLPKTGTANQLITGTLTNTVVTSNSANPTANNQSVTFTATITPNQGSVNPTGTVDFFADGLPLGTANVTNGTGNTGTASVTVSTNAIQVAGNNLVITPGIHSITAVYTPTGAFVGGTGSLAQPVKANAFTAGDLLVYRAGDGTNALTVDGNAVYIDEFAPTGSQATPKQSIIMPTMAIGSNQALITCSQQSAEGQLSLSADGQYLLLTGYDTAVGGNVDVHTSTAASIPRTIGRIKFDGTIDTSMALTDLADGGSVRGVASPDGSQVYAAGSTGGIRYVPGYTGGLQTSIQIDSGSNNTNGATGPLTLNNLVIAGGQLYVTDSANGNTVKVATVGTGVPTTTGQVDIILPGLPTGATTTADPNTNAPGFPLGVYFTHLQTGPVVGADTMYVVDDGANFFGGTISKWSFANGTWTKTDTILSNGTGINDPVPSFDHLNGSVSNGTVNLFATYGNGGNGITGPGGLYGMVDTGGFNMPIPSHTITTLASAPVGSNETFRGVSVVPQQAQQVVGVAGIQVNDGTIERSEVRSITVTFTGQATFAGGNANAAAAFELDHINDTTSHFATARPVGLTAAVSTNGSNQTVVTLTFSGAETDPISVQQSVTPVAGPSLSDGRYTLTVFASAITGFNGGGASGNYVTTPDNFGGSGPKLYRDFGDADGSGAVDSIDLGQFRSTYNANTAQANYLLYMDANNSGAVDAQDLGQFRSHYNTNVFI